MATLLLGIVGNAILPGAGGFIGATIGSILDSQVIFPLLFPPPPQEGPRVADRQIQLATEGSDGKWVIGPRNRVAGTVIWMTDLVEHVHVRRVGQSLFGIGGTRITTYTYTVDFAVHVCSTADLPGGRIRRIRRIWAGMKLIWNSDSDVTPVWESLAIHDGSQTTADPTIELTKGIGNVPSYNGNCVVVFKGFEVTSAEFGNQLPSLTFLVEQQADLSTGGAIGYVANHAGMPAEEYDTSRVSSCFRGMSIAGPQSQSSVMENLLVGYAVGAQETGGYISFFSRGNEYLIPIEPGDLGTRELGLEPPPLLERVDPNDFVIASDVHVTFISTDNDFQQGSVGDRRIDRPLENVVRLTLPLTLSPAEANGIARRFNWSSEAERQKVKVTLPPSYVEVQEGDILQVTLSGRDYEVYLSQVNRGANFLIEGEGVLTQRAVYVQNGVAQGPGYVIPTTGAPAATRLFMLDAPALTSVLADQVGLYYAICNEDPDDPWRGASLYAALTEAGPFTLQQPALAESVMGTVLEPPGHAVPWLWDDVNHVDIELNGGELTGCTEEECLAGLNRAAIQNVDGSWEIIGFQVAEQIDAVTYRISNLLRGLRGTETSIDDHIVGENFLLLDDSVGFLELGPAGLGAEAYYKAPAVGGLESDYPSQPAQCDGLTMRPFSPTHLKVVEGPGGADNFYSSGATTITAAASGSTFTGPSMAFSRFLPGGWVTVAGWANAGNNGRFRVLSVLSGGSVLTVDGSLTDETLGEINFADGSPDDISISWNRRSKQVVPLYRSAPLSSDESPLGFIVEIRRGGLDTPVLRRWETDQERVVFTQDEQDLAALPANFRLTIRVQQVSQVTGAGFAAQEAFIR